MSCGSADPWPGSFRKQSILANTTLLQFCKYMNMLLHDSICMCVTTVFQITGHAYHYHCDNELV